MMEEEAVITINEQTIKVVAGAGRNSPDGPKIDLPPGRYKYTFKVASRAAQSEEVVIGADETWGLVVAPGGMLPLHPVLSGATKQGWRDLMCTPGRRLWPKDVENQGVRCAASRPLPNRRRKYDIKSEEKIRPAVAPPAPGRLR